MIARHWTGLCRPEYANEYTAHLKDEVFPGLEAIEGFIQASVLTRAIRDGVEFLVITKWESREAIKQFAGADYNTAVVPPKVRDWMMLYDEKVRHYEVRLQT